MKFIKTPGTNCDKGLALSKKKKYETALDLIKHRFGKKDFIVRYKIDAY